MTRATAARMFWVAGMLLAAAIGLQVVPLRPRLPDLPVGATVAPAPDVDPSAQAAALLTYEEIVRVNPLAQDREPPPERYVPPGLRAASPDDQSTPAPEPPRLRLFGVATAPTGAVALIDADPSIPGAEIYRIGDRVGVYRLESIAESVVVLRGPSGIRTLQLELSTGRSR